MSKSGQVPIGDVRLTLNVREELHQKLKIASAMTRTTMGQLVEQLIKEKLNEMLRAAFGPSADQFRAGTGSRSARSGVHVVVSSTTQLRG